MESLERELALEMQSWESAGLLRTLEPESAGPGLVDFVSNDYLGLSRHPDVVAAARRALEDCGAGSGASRLLGGGSRYHEQSEAAAAEWLGAEAALLFPSGYQANLGLVGALTSRGDAIFSDELNHASLIDAARLSRARVFVHRHLDFEELDEQLARAAGARRRLVLTEGIFSMAGDAPDLGALAEICERHHALLVVDEAHSVGLIGTSGAGAWAELESPRAPIAARVVTGGKALGVGGAFVVGSRSLCEHLVNRARSFMFTTAPPPAMAAALEASILIAREADDGRAKIHALAKTLASAFAVPVPKGAILPLGTETNERAIELATLAATNGLDVRAVRPPTVPAHAVGLRVVVHAFNSESECDELVRTVGVPSLRSRAQSAAPSGRALFVIGTDTSVGKTVVSALLLRQALRVGRAAYWKPVQTGDESDTEAVGTLAAAAPHELLRPAWSLPLPASPHAAAEDAGVSIERSTLEHSLEEFLRTMPDTNLVVELAGGLLVPYRLEPTVETQADWLEAARAPVVLVARAELGTLNHTLLTLEALRARHLEPRALFLVGEPHPSNRRTLEEISGVERVFEVPTFPVLATDALDGWLETNDLTELFEK